MFRLSDHAERTLVRLRDTAQKILHIYFLEVQQEPTQAREGQQTPITKEQMQAVRTPVEAPPQFSSEEVGGPGIKRESKGGVSLKVVTRIGKSIFIRGDLSSKEDVTVDGRIEGKVDLKDHHLIIGPAGVIHADVLVRNVTVEGSVVGNVSASGMVTLQSTGSLVGDISAARVAIDEGADFKGAVNIVLAKAQAAKG